MVHPHLVAPDHLDHERALFTARNDREGIPMDIKDNNNVDRQVSQSDNLRFASADRESVLLYSGQPKIIQAWSDWMRDHGGLKLRFEPNGSLFSNDVLLHIEYWKRGGPGLDVQPNMKLHQPVHITQAKKLVDANKCLQLTTIYRPGSYCDVQIQTASLWDSFSVAMPFVDDKGNPASVSAFLPVRAELKTESKKWPSQGTDIMLYAYANESVAEPNRIANRQVN